MNCLISPHTGTTSLLHAAMPRHQRILRHGIVPTAIPGVTPSNPSNGEPSASQHAVAFD